MRKVNILEGPAIDFSMNSQSLGNLLGPYQHLMGLEGGSR